MFIYIIIYIKDYLKNVFVTNHLQDFSLIVMMNWHIEIRSETELKIRSELALKLYDFVKTLFKLHHIVDQIIHELCHVQLDNAWQTFYSWSIFLSYRELLNN